MTRKEMQNLFDALRRMVCMTEAQRAYDARAWRDCVSLWHGIFAGDSYETVWAGVRRYIHDGGRYWPYPGEIADLMPAYDVDVQALCELRYTTRAAARARDKRAARSAARNTWEVCHG
jgi:hypothetical protein